jgi:excinuclease ABC subunit A
VSVPEKRRQPTHGKVTVRGARGRNLQNITVDFPLGLMCLVTGVSGSGKSTLVQDTLAKGLIHRMTREGEPPLEADAILGEGQIDEVVLIDQSPLSRSSRSNPVTYVKAFDEIRKVMAETTEAKIRNLKASHFSFNGKAGRCETCSGEGQVSTDMQFLADISMRCPDCHGTRYKPDILTALHRGKSIADILDMTVREAFGFFRGQHKVQTRLKSLIDVGLEYLALGQASNTLSGGEAQRLKLAGYLSAKKKNRTLFIMDEPTTGLHFADVVKLLDCFGALLEVGHSLIVVEHNVQLMRAADYLIDLGPGAGDAGGQVVATGTPEEVARNKDSATGRILAAGGLV